MKFNIRVSGSDVSILYKGRQYKRTITPEDGLGSSPSEDFAFCLPNNLQFVQRCINHDPYHFISIEPDPSGDWIRMSCMFEYNSFRFSYEVLLE
jgi:hypothetical protein